MIAKYILGDPRANAWVAGGVISTDFLKNRPDVAKRYSAAWLKAVDFVNANPKEARKHLAKNTFTPDNVVDTVPLVKFTKVADLLNTDWQGLPGVHRLLDAARHAARAGGRQQVPRLRF